MPLPYCERQIMFLHIHKLKAEKSSSQQERRWMQRVPVHSYALICTQDDACEQCIITSINANGMLIEAENTHLEPGSHTTVELLIECEDGEKYQSETVRVVHADDRTVAVAFVDYSFSHLRTMQKLFHEGQHKHQHTDTQTQPAASHRMMHHW